MKLAVDARPAPRGCYAATLSEQDLEYSMTWMRSSLLFVVLMLAACQREEPQAPFDLVEATIADIQGAIRTGRTSCRAVVEGYLARIEAYD